MTPKVFVSSTYEDLKEHRAHVIGAVRSAGFFVDPMEDWTADTREPKEFSQERMEGCNLCILLVALRRGHIPDGETQSITQLEYRHAIDLGIDVIPFCLNESAQWPRDFDELDSDPGIREWRSELYERKGVGEFDNAPSSIEIGPALTRWLQHRNGERDRSNEGYADDATRHGGLWNVPYPKNPYFTGRDSYLEEIHNRLHEAKSAVAGQAIRGLGGIGKTEIAVAYAYKFGSEYDAIFWVRADSELEIQQGLLNVHALLWPDVALPTLDDAIRNVHKWLRDNSDWLLIFDNADAPELLKPYLPSIATGHVLLTSRANSFRSLQIASPIELPSLETEDAAAFLLRSTGREDASEEEKDAALEIARKLDGLPLALEQAASFVQQGALFSDYLESYRRQSIPWLEEGTAESRQYPKSVATTWLLNFKAVEKESPAAAELLRFTAFLGPDEIPYELLIESASELGTVLSEALAGADEQPLIVNKLLNPLARYSLVRFGEDRTYSTHRLVQEVTKHALGMDNCRRWARRAVATINSVFPNPEFSNWRLCSRLAPHAEMAVTHLTDYGPESPEPARVCSCLGIYLESQGQYRLAEPLFQQALEITRTALGVAHPDFATSLNNLAELYRAMGRHAEAEPLYQQALEVRRTALGEVHPDFATSLNNLGGLYAAVGRHAEAEPLYQQALEIYRTALGETHPSFAASLNNLAELYRAMGHHAEAEPLYQQALEIRRTALGEAHPDFATSLNNLALLYRAMGHHAEAEPLYQQALEITRAALGETHPSFASSLNNLGGLYDAMGRHVEAEPLYQQALEITRTALGESHPAFAQSLNNLAGLYRAMGRHAEAEPLYQQALEIYRTALGESHPDFATSLNNLGGLYAAMGHHAEAEQLYQQALEIRRTALGESHPDFATSLNNLGGLHAVMGHHAEAEPLYQQALEIYRTALGEAHTSFATSLNNLALLYDAMGHHAEAEPLYQQAREIYRTAQGRSAS